MKKILKKILEKPRFSPIQNGEKPHIDRNHRKELEAKVDAGLQRAIREYRETFRILADYDRS